MQEASSFEKLLAAREQVQCQLKANSGRSVLLDELSLAERHIAEHECSREEFVAVERGLRVLFGCFRVESQSQLVAYLAAHEHLEAKPLAEEEK